MNYTAEELKGMAPSQPYFVGIDSDGCVFDTMEIKHKECFCPQYIHHFGLQPVSRYAREAWEFVNLYSKTRGVNRFKALIRALDLLGDREEVKARQTDVPRMQGVREWMQHETKLGNPALTAEVERNPNADLKKALQWSTDVNATVQRMVRNVPPFPMVRDSLEAVAPKADVIVVSQTPTEALEREWREHSLTGFVRFIAGQELGTKSEHLAFAAAGKYSPERILMVGDAPGDLAAAKENSALFYPIIPGFEESSWKRFHGEALARFFDGSYAGDYEERLVEEFQAHLPETAPWQS